MTEQKSQISRRGLLGATAGGVAIGGIGLGVLIASIFIMAATLISTYTTTAYHTCLYLWARNVESARQTGGSTAFNSNVAAPAPLAAVL